MIAELPWKIVLIDDEADIREVVSIALKDAGYAIAGAPDGETGIQLCHDTAPQIVMTDIRMPGMDGLQVLAYLKKHTPDIEVIVITAFGEMELAIKALQLDASDFITKPINDDTLFLALDRAKQRYTARRQVRDYTALLESENARTSQELMRHISFQKNLIDSSIDGIVGCDGDHRIITYNRSMIQILGYPREIALNGMKLPDVFPAGEWKRFEAELASDAYGGVNRLALFETTLLSHDGQKVPAQISATTLYANDPEGGRVCFIRDLRAFRKLEQEVADQARILHQDKMMSLGRLAASVVHEINNPLSGVLNYIRLMIKIVGRGPINDQHQEKFGRYLDLVEKETDRCSQIISNLLSFSRKSSPVFGEVKIGELIQRSILLSQHKLTLSGIHIHTEVENHLPLVKGDFNQLQQCLINLIFNAIDAMPDGGELFIDARYASPDKAVLIRVKDNGVGMDANTRNQIFDPFFTTKKEGYGVGLGLSTVYGIIDRHKGSITVDSQPGQETIFTIKLPLAEQA